MKAHRTYHLVVERDEDGVLVATVPELPGCHTQARALTPLERRAKEAIQLYIEEFPETAAPRSAQRFVGVHTVEV